MADIERDNGVSTGMSAAVALPGRRPASRTARAAGPAAAGALASAYLSLIVLIPLAAVVAKSLDGGVGMFWDAITAPQAVAAIKLTLICSADRRGDQHRLRDGDRLGAGARRVPGQARGQRA